LTEEKAPVSGKETGASYRAGRLCQHELLTEIAPGVKRAAFMFNPDTAPGIGSYFLPSFEAAAQSLKVHHRSAAAAIEILGLAVAWRGDSAPAGRQDGYRRRAPIGLGNDNGANQQRNALPRDADALLLKDVVLAGPELEQRGTIKKFVRK
jgi:hypothetical protein